MPILTRTTQYVCKTDIAFVLGPTGAEALLLGETQGFAIDATVAGGNVVVRSTGDPSDNVTNTAIGSWAALTNTNASTKVVKWSDGTLHTIAANTVAQEYESTTGRWAILTEMAATNIMLQSADFATTWTNNNSTESTNATTAPDGTLTADKIIEDGTAGVAHNVTQSPSITSGSRYTFSCYAKAAERTWLVMTASTTGYTVDALAYFDLANGVVGTVVGGGTTISGIETIGNGWYRCTLGGLVCDATGANVHTIGPTTGDGNATHNGDNASGIYVWGAMLEEYFLIFSTASTRPTSYIATTTVQVTRTVDSILLPTSAVPWSGTAGTFVIWFKAQGVDQQDNGAFFFANDGTTAESWGCLSITNTNPNGMGVVATDGGAAQFATPHATGTIVVGGNKVAAWASLNDAGVLADGGSENQDTVFTMPTVTTIGFGDRPVLFARGYQGYLYQITYVPRRMTTVEMQTRTA